MMGRSRRAGLSWTILLGLDSADLDEVIHADRVLRPGYSGYIDIVEPGETVLLRKHFLASMRGRLHERGGNRHLV